MAFARRPHLISRGRSLSLSPRRLGFETLESRLVLSSMPMADYDRVSAEWFASTVETAPGGSDRWIVRLTPEATSLAGSVGGAATLLGDLPVTVVRGLGLPGQLLVTSQGVSTGTVTEALSASSFLATFRRDSQIKGAQFSNDTNFADQYALYNVSDTDIDADLAWDITTGTSDVVIAVIDSGIYLDHPDLIDNIWSNPGEIPGDGIDNDNNQMTDDVVGWDFRNHDNNPTDDHGHGTHVAGGIGAAGNNAVGVAGVNWSTSLLPIKFLDKNNLGSIIDAVAAINYVTMLRTREVDPVNVRIINASWGGSGADHPDLRAAIAGAGAAGILFVTAAGNGDVFGRGQNIDDFPFYPAEYDLNNVLVVAATDQDDQLTNFSNYGVSSVDVAAPGLSVLNTNLFIDGSTVLPQYGVSSGTSMATPLVAGTAALLWSAAPDATVSEIREAILAGGDPKANLAGKIASGRRLNAFGAFVELPPQVELTSADDILAFGDDPYTFNVNIYKPNNATSTLTPLLQAASIGNGDFVIRRQGGTTGNLSATLLTTPPVTNGSQFALTYQITPPGGTWDAADIGVYDIVLVGGQVTDTGGTTSVEKIVGTFEVDLSGAGVFDPTITTDSGPGSLREAVSLANTITPEMNGVGGVVILKPGIYTLSIPGAGEDNNFTGDLDITGTVNIASDGTGEVIIDAGGLDRIFDVHAGAALTLTGVTIRGGHVAGEDGGGIRNYGELTLINSSVEDSEASSEFQYQVLTPVGDEFLVNSNVPGNQRIPEVVADGEGRAFVAWESNETGIAEVYGSYVESSGPLGSTFPISGPGAPDSAAPGVALTVNSRAIAVYRTGFSQVDVRTFDLNTADGVGFSLPGPTTEFSGSARVAVDPSSIFGMVVWAQDGDTNVGARRFAMSPTGDSWSLIGSAFTVNTTPKSAGFSLEPDVAIDEAGNAVVVWSSRPEGETQNSVYMQRFDSTGTPLGTETKVNTSPAHATVPHVVYSDGGFIISWETRPDAGDDYNAVLRHYDASGVPQSGEIVIAGESGTQRRPRLAPLPDGGYFAVWESAGPLDTGFNVRGQQYSVTGARIGPEVTINSYTTGDQNHPTISVLATNELLVVWEGEGEGDAQGIHGRILAEDELITVSSGGSGGGIFNAGTLLLDNSTVEESTADVGGGGIYNTPGATATVIESTIAENVSHGVTLPTLDASFGSGGKVTTGIGGHHDGGRDVLVQPDGKILVAGFASNGTDNDFALVRYNVDGSLDTSFGGTGGVITDFGGDDFGRRLALQEDGKILVAGSTSSGGLLDLAIARYNVDGSLDTNFHGDGKVVTNLGSTTEYITGIAVQDDGRIVVAGSRHNGSNLDAVVARYTAAGVLDSSFNGDGNSDGWVIASLGAGEDETYDMALQSDGKIVIGGYQGTNFAVGRLNPNGSFDTSFDGDGKSTVVIGSGSIGRSLAIQPDGKIIVAGLAFDGMTNDFGLARFNTNGTLDTGFDGDGKVATDFGSTTDEALEVTVQTDGRIVVVGYSSPAEGVSKFAISRYNVDGTLDTSLDGDGRFVTDFGGGAFNRAESVAVQGDGKIVVVGSAIQGSTNDFAVLRLNAASPGGGGIFNAGTLNVEASTIEGNTATGDGGGVYNADGATANVASSTINGNEAEGFSTYPIAYYSADGTAHDSANDHNAVLFGGATYGPGVADQAFELSSASGTFVEVPSLTTFNSQAFTVAAWINAESAGSINDAEGGTVVGKDFGYGSAAFMSFGIFGPGNTGHFDFIVGFTDDTQVLVTSTNSFPLGDWHHVAMTWDGEWLRGYVDGILEADTFVAGNKQIHYNPANPVTIGSHSSTETSGTGSRRFDGRIDEVKIYDRALTVQEFQAVEHPGDGGGIYNAGELTATNVTISGNEAANQGGGVFNADGAMASVASSTVTQNSAYAPEPDFEPGYTQLTSLSVPAASEAIAAGDLNGDGTVDLLTGSSNGTLSLFRGNADGTFESPSFLPISGFYPGDDLTIVDLNDDGHQDIVAPHYLPLESGSVRILFGTGNGNFQPSVTYDTGGGDWGANGVSVGDFDSDGFTDLAIVNYGVWSTQSPGSVKILWGSQTGAFVDGPRYPLLRSMTDVVAGNIDADPDLELVATGFSYSAIVLDYVGNRQFAPAAPIVVLPGSPSGVEEFYVTALADINGDSKLDFTVVHGTANSLHVLLGNGNGTFQTKVTYAALGAPQDIVAQDINGDDLIDLVVTSSDSAHLFLNTGSGALSSPIPLAVVAGIRGTVVSDFDGNASPDLAFVREDGSGEARVFLNQASYAAAGGISNALVGGSSVILKNSIVAQNFSTLDSPDVVGSYVSQGGNLIGEFGVARGLVHNVNADQVGTSTSPIDPQLGPLADNGGPTKTHLPAAKSPAIDAGIASGAPSTDQRGVARPADGDNNGTATIDIGAVERYYSSISGKKFRDDNQNGIQDGGEVGIAGWTMYLDLDNDGQLDASEPTAVTDAGGNYSFTRLAPGTYTVAEDGLPGWTQTYTSTAFATELLDSSNGTLGLDGARSMADTADGKFVYVAGPSEAKIQRFSRDAITGALTPIGATTTTELVSMGGPNVLSGVVKLVVAPVATASGLYLYALSPDGALSVFRIDTMSGDLTLVDVVRNGDSRGTVVSRLIGSTGLAVSPDGQRVYVSNMSANALNGGTILVFERVTGQTPELRLRRILNNGTGAPPAAGAGGSSVVAYGSKVYVGGETADSSDTLATFTVAGSPGYLTYTSILRNGENGVSGIDGISDLEISPDGKYLYASAATDGAVTVFSRDANGVLTFVQSLAEGAIDDSGSIVAGVQEASSVEVSSDGSRLYVTGRKYFDEFGISLGAVAVFLRNTETGRLTFLHSLVDTIPDVYGAAIENIDSAVDSYAFEGQVYVISGGDEDAVTTFHRDGEGLDTHTLLVGQDLAGVNSSSYAAPAEIRGIVYSDINNNGTRDADEVGLGGISVYLDVNGNNVYDDGPQNETTTDALGQYAFEDLAAPGSYTVRLNLLPNQSVTSPPSADNNEWALDLEPAEVVAGTDFLVHSSVQGQGANQISGFVWQDTNADGVRQGNEPFLSGRRVYLDVNDNGMYDALIDITASALTSAEGQYSFTGLGAANFVVRVETTAQELTSTPVGNSFLKQTLTTGANPLGLVSADFNNDGRPDLATVDGSVDSVSVRLQLPDSSFATRVQYTVGSQPTALVVGKFNNDNFPDIAVVHWSLSKVVFLINNGNGTFTRGAFATEVLVSSGYTSIAAADIDGDGDDDLAVAVDAGSNNVDYVQILRNNNGTSPSFSQIQQISLGTSAPLSIAAGDLTGDNRPEFVVGNFETDTVRVLLNSGGTSFSLQSSVSVDDGPSSVAIVPDMNGDGHKDVVVASVGGNVVTILKGNGAGGLSAPTEVLVGQGPRSVTIADVDQDGDLDLIVGKSLTNDVVVLRREGPGLDFSFSESSGLASFSDLVVSGVKQVLAKDLNGDGVLDLAAVRGSVTGGSLEVLHNALAAGSFRLAIPGLNTTEPNRNFGITLAVELTPGDFDGDGDVDGRDFLVWQRNPSVGSIVSWQDNYGSPGGLGASSALSVSADEYLAESLRKVESGVPADSPAIGGTNFFVPPIPYGVVERARVQRMYRRFDIDQELISVRYERELWHELLDHRREVASQMEGHQFVDHDREAASWLEELDEAFADPTLATDLF